MRRKRSAMFGLLVALTPVVAACAGGTPVTAAQTATQTATATTSIKAAAPVPTATEALAATLPQTVPASQAATGGNQIRVVIGDAVLAGQLWDNATARDLLSQLPLTLTFRDCLKSANDG